MGRRAATRLPRELGSVTYLIYMRITERKIDAELREFFETEGKEE